MQRLGGYGAFQVPSTRYQLSDQKEPRRRLNLMAVVVAIVGPTAIFAGLSYLYSFKVRFNLPWLCFLATVLVGVAILGMMGNDAFPNLGRRENRMHPTMWIRFVFILYCMACLLGSLTGEFTYTEFTKAFYSINVLNTYTEVDVGTANGYMIMDGGLVHFKKGAFVDREHHGYFKNQKVYCVAPIKTKSMTSGVNDFWIANLDCCGENKFECGVKSVGDDAWGVRRLQGMDADRPFFKLAVEQTANKYNMTARNPLFFTWTDTPQDFVSGKEKAAMNRFLTGLCIWFGIDITLTLFMCLIITRKNKANSLSSAV